MEISKLPIDIIRMCIRDFDSDIVAENSPLRELAKYTFGNDTVGAMLALAPGLALELEKRTRSSYEKHHDKKRKQKRK